MIDFDDARPCITLCEICDETSTDGYVHPECLEEANRLNDLDDDFASLAASLEGCPETDSEDSEDWRALERDEFNLWVRLLEGRWADTDRLAEVA